MYLLMSQWESLKIDDPTIDLFLNPPPLERINEHFEVSFVFQFCIDRPTKQLSNISTQFPNQVFQCYPLFSVKYKVRVDQEEGV